MLDSCHWVKMSDQENSLSRFSGPGWIWYYCCWLIKIIYIWNKKKKKKCGSYSLGQTWNNLKINLWCDQTAKECDKRSSPQEQDVTCCCIAATHWWWSTNIRIAWSLDIVLNVLLLVMDNPYCLITRITGTVTIKARQRWHDYFT